MIMKKSIIFNTIVSLAAVFGLAACDTDVDHYIADVDAPVQTSIYPSAGSIIKPGAVNTIRVTFNKNIFFASANTSQITLNGSAVTSAKVLGSDSVLTITTDFPAADSYDLEIPAGLITGPNNMPVAAISQQWKGVKISIATSPCNTNANAETKALYNNLVNNYGKKIYSATMADVNWNYTNATKVKTLTGKYPAINCFDFIHMPYSGQNWINYSDITPVKEWHDAGGIVAAMWHWLVPVQPLSVAEVVMPSSWSGSLQLNDDAAKTIFAKATVGDQIIVHYTNAAGAQGSFKDGSTWSGLVDESKKSYDYFDISKGSGSFYITLDATTLAAIQKSGIIISGHDYTLTSVNLTGKAEGGDHSEYSYRPEYVNFNCAKVLEEGTTENIIFTRDLATMATHLKALQSANIPVIWRPLHEASGNTEVYSDGKAWFWWGYSGADQFKKIWQYMFSYFQQQGINNLIWVWTGAAYDSNWYPGDSYVDIVGADIYNVSSASAIAKQFSDMQYTYTNKMITMSECGAIANISDIWNAGGKWGLFMPWYGNYSEGTPHASDSWWQAAMNDTNVINR